MNIEEKIFKRMKLNKEKLISYGFVKENKMKSGIQSMYFSLGNKESKVRNQVLATVEKHTKEIENIYHSQGIKTIYEENEGNHFHEADLRMAKGIKWILEEI